MNKNLREYYFFIKKVISKPFYLLLIFLILGVLIASQLRFAYLDSVYILLLIILVIFIINMYYSNKFIVLILIFLLGFTLYLNTTLTNKTYYIAEEKASVDIVAYIDRVNEYSFYKEIRIKTIEVDKNKVKEKNIVRVDTIYDFNKGDFVLISTNKLEPIYDYEMNGYYKYLFNNGFKNIIYADEINIIDYNEKDRYYFKNNIYIYLNSFIESSIEDENVNIAKSLFFGNQGFLDEIERDKLSKAGVSHIVAVSGLHIGIFILFLTNILGVLKINKKYLYILVALILFIYGYIVSFPISILRAMGMYYLFLMAYYFNMPYDPLHSLFMVGFINVLINPTTIFTVSFQLSFLATFGIITLYKPLKELCSFLPTNIKSLLIVTLIAQVSTMPLIAYYFNEIPLFSILANIMIMPILPIILIFNFTAIIVSFFSINMGIAINFFTNSFINYLMIIVELINKLPFSSINIKEFRFIYIIFYYKIFLLLIIKVNKNYSNKRL